MLSIAPLSGGLEQYYLGLAKEDYYLKGGEPPGRWLGPGAQALGLGEKVTKPELTRLLRGLHPKTGLPLGQVQQYRPGRERQPGWDLTFSAPKSVSVLWALGTRDIRAAIQQAHFEAVQEALWYIATTASYTRRGRGGRIIEKAAPVIAAFEHGTSRAQDPQLHTHCLVSNLGLRADGTWGTLRSRDIYQHKMSAGAIYRAHLASLLVRRLGLALCTIRTWFEVQGVPKALLSVFSTRRRDILQALSAAGVSDAKAAALFAKTTRTAKAHIPRRELFQKWQGAALEQGTPLDPDLLSPKAGLEPRTELEQAKLLGDALEATIAALTQGNSHFAERDVVRGVAEALQSVGIGAADILSHVSAAIRSGVVQLPAIDGHTRLTTPEMLALEKALMKEASVLAQEHRHIVTERALTSAMSKGGPLNAEQAAALTHITHDKGDLKLISGRAGTGKTHLLSAARIAWERSGLSIVGAALAARAARELQKGSHIASSTIERLLIRIREQERQKPVLTHKSILVIDEAGMVGTRQMHELLSAVRAARAKVVLVGDERQLQPIEAGGPFNALRTRYGSATLSTNVRQKEAWMREAVAHFAEGNAQAGLRLMPEHGCLHMKDTKEAAIASLLSDWATLIRAFRQKDFRDVLVLGGTRADVHDLNLRAQQCRRELGQLKAKGVLKGTSCNFHIGDRVVFTANNSSLGVLNGDFGTVIASEQGFLFKPQLLVELDEPGKRGLLGRPKPRHVLIAVDSKMALELGYAITTHKAQGATVQHSFVLGGGAMADRELSYVQMSRARIATHLYAALPTAEEGDLDLSAAMSRSRRKDLALDVLARTKEAGLRRMVG